MRAKKTTSALRQFAIPHLNFDAEDYSDLIYWPECEITESPITVPLSYEYLEKLGMENSIKDLVFYKFPCHTQAVERCVKLVIEASSKVYGVERREGYIRSTLASRGIMPSFENKSQYKIHQKSIFFSVIVRHFSWNSYIYVNKIFRPLFMSFVVNFNNFQADCDL